jgi:hypothetical protein
MLHTDLEVLGGNVRSDQNALTNVIQKTVELITRSVRF